MTDREAWTQWVQQTSAAGDVALVRVSVPVRSKYGARRVEVDGVQFDSQREADRYRELRLRQAAGQISALEVHPRYALHVYEAWRGDGPPYHFAPIGTYTADFRYVDSQTGEVVIEDVKSEPTKTTSYRWKKRHVEAEYGITVTEVA